MIQRESRTPAASPLDEKKKNPKNVVPNISITNLDRLTQKYYLAVSLLSSPLPWPGESGGDIVSYSILLFISKKYQLKLNYKIINSRLNIK